MRTPLPSSPIEFLESRIAPATITVTFDRGALTLTQDDDAATFSITGLGDSRLLLQGTGTTDFHMEGAPDAASLILNGALKSLTINLGSSNDTVGLTGLIVGGDVTILGGTGENQIEIKDLTTKGSFRFTGGADADSVKLLGGSVGGDITLLGGAGANEIEAQGLTIKGGFKFTGGADEDTVTLLPDSLSVKKDFVLEMGDGANLLTTSASLQVGGKLSYLGGTGEDAFKTENGSIRVGGDFSFKPGAGNAELSSDLDKLAAAITIGKKLVFDSSASLAGDAVEFALGAATTKIGGDLQITDGAGDLAVNPLALSLSIGGKLLLTSGAGTFNASFASALSAKSITIDASAGSTNTLQFNVYGKVSGGITYTGGSDADFVLLAVSGLGGGGLGPIVIDVGDGLNNASVAGFVGGLKTVKLIGGSGDDYLGFLSAAASVASIDIQPGGGTNVMQFGLNSTTVTGKVSVTGAADAVANSVTVLAKDGVMGSLALSLPGGSNQIEFGTDPVPPGGGGGGEEEPALGLLPGPINGLTIKKAFTVTGGSGVDNVHFRDAADLTVAGGINLNLGAGANEVTGTPANLVAKSFTLIGGAEADTLTLAGTGKLGAVSLTLGAGTNSATFTGGLTPLALASLVLTSTSAILETDTLALARVIVAGKLDAKFGAGNSGLSIDESFIGGSFTADTGAGADSVAIEANLPTLGATTLVKAVKISLGAGDDQLLLGGNGVLVTKATFTADGGTDTNGFTNDPDNTFAKTPVFTGF